MILRRRGILKRATAFLARTEWPLIPAAALLLGAGLLVQWSVSGAREIPSGHLIRVAAAILAAFAAAWFFTARRLKSHAWLFYGLSIVGLLVVLAAGRTTNHARRWIDLFGGFKIQPSEFMKLALILALAKWFADRPRPRRLEDLVVPAALTLLPAALVLGQPDLGTALTFGPLFLAMAWAAGTPWKTLRWVVFLPVVLAPLAWFGVQDYQRERVEIWWRQGELTAEEKGDAGYHLWHAKLAVGSGGMNGFGWGEGPENRLDRLPERHTDFVFPVIAEEGGFLSAAALLLAYAALVGLALHGASRHRDPFVRLLIAGIGVHFAVHLVINVGVALALWPATGLPLPLVSWGGSSLAVAGLAIGAALAAGASREPVFSSRAFGG